MCQPKQGQEKATDGIFQNGKGSWCFSEASHNGWVGRRCCFEKAVWPFPLRPAGPGAPLSSEMSWVLLNWHASRTPFTCWLFHRNKMLGDSKWLVGGDCEGKLVGEQRVKHPLPTQSLSAANSDFLALDLLRRSSKELCWGFRDKKGEQFCLGFSVMIG